ncbi:hypothetical protein V495_02058 [Pseudogymnoascus sp. VKM F-4514 (FW-929)]|nr:hypothetical protein V495_02058 [Pseudogymnoascus sp. VKM F-4514 (FW-929)]KFY61061.1 hypothetical protein V497_03187 [Pseudogymnoascus sp. VKM F-4516 (FW-969)]
MRRPSFPAGINRRQLSTLHYQTFPTAPPRTPLEAPLSPFESSAEQDRLSNSDDENQQDHSNESPFPRRQLVIIAVIALAEQTALNSISPYLPQMASSFPATDPSPKIGLYVGAIGSAFAAAQFMTSYFWGFLSDRTGRKPIILICTFLTAACFIAFGFCTKLWQAILVQTVMGLVNGNQGIISTCLGEITDRSNRNRAFAWLPFIFGLGGITGPALGGLLVRSTSLAPGEPRYPYLLPNLASAAILMLDLILTAIFLEESLKEAKDLPPLKGRVVALFAWVWQFASSAVRPSYFRRGHRLNFTLYDGHAELPDDRTSISLDSESSSLLSLPEIFAGNSEELSSKVVWNRNTLLLLGTYLVVQLSNISFNALYPIFAFAPAPLGRDIPARAIGISLSAVGAASILFQLCTFGRLKVKIGHKTSYRAGLGLLAIALFAMPFVAYRDFPALLGSWSGELAMWIQIILILLMKTVGTVGSLTSGLLLITNLSPSAGSLGALNGLAQTLSAAGRAVGPVLAGGLFSAASGKGRLGAIIPFGVFGGLAMLGCVASLGIRGERLEGQSVDERGGLQSGEDGEED